jgi:hypothetical protein
MFFCNALKAQDNFDLAKIDEMHNQKWQFLISKANLSETEIEKVYPVFMEYEKSIWNLHQENRDLYKQALKKNNSVKPNYADLNDKYIDFEFKQALLLRKYHYQLRKILEAETLFNYYKGEREYKRQLLQSFKSRKEHNPPPK